MLASAVAPSRVPPRPRARRARRRATVRAVGDATDARPPRSAVARVWSAVSARVLRRRPGFPFASPDAAAKLDVVYEGVPTTAYTFPVPLNAGAPRFGGLAVGRGV